MRRRYRENVFTCDARKVPEGFFDCQRAGKACAGANEINPAYIGKLHVGYSICKTLGPLRDAGQQGLQIGGGIDCFFHGTPSLLHQP